ncbi:MAG TPA: ATP-binding protein [Coleofasciculaceae cyanobacterium]
MNSQWQAANEQYLSAALAALRLRLLRLAKSSDAARVEAIAPAAAATEPPPALLLLSQQFGLSDFEQQVLLLCAAMEFDTQMATLCAQAQDDLSRRYPTFALALSCFDQPAWDVVSPERPLRYWRLLEIHQSGMQPLTTSPLRADERIVNYLKGLNELDDRLTSYMVPLEIPLEIPQWQIPIPPSQQAAVASLLQALESQPWTKFPILQLAGIDSLSKQLIAQHTANKLGLRLYRLPVELLPSHTQELETLARLWHRESLLLPIALYLDAHDADPGQTSLLQRFLLRTGGLFFLSTRDAQAHLGPLTYTVDVTKPTPIEQQQLWELALKSATPSLPSSPAQLSSQFNLNPIAIGAIAQQVLIEHSTTENSQALSTQLWDACLTRTRPQLDSLAQRLHPKATWDTLVLPAEETHLLHQIADQIRQRSTVYQTWGFNQRMNRGLGISALFAGESGTGKTMAAEVIANDLRLNLYRIDLSAVVSKYIGETEKNLRRLFDAAEDGGAILFFDEADALFGKRSEVKDSHDRYANIEINYLLQRLESYSGLAILATNLKNALDPAFMRRLRFILNFPFPGIKERQQIWQKAFPLETPTQGLDFEHLARLNLAGGNIHSVVLNAAFLAAQAATAVTMPIVLSAARIEYRKLDRPINESDFRWSNPEATL